MRFKTGCCIAAALSVMAGGAAVAEVKKPGPADGYAIHVLAPHQMEDGTVGGPFHHYCKPIQGGVVLQCLLFTSTAPDAALVGVEYFIEKGLARKNVPLIQWNRHFHDHEVEIATGRVQVLDVSPEEASAIAQKAAGTDGIIFELWQENAVIPDGKVTFPTSVGHVFRTK
ncbi:MAG: hypothetical protein FD174_2194 [Geobacteraceae bacterium]|nr:MAG: hypothetical protein FD174_2194 [Geobacteraceae bacterium]